MNTSSRAILLQNVSKSYRLYEKPAHRVKETFHPFGKKYSSTFKALKNITTEIFQGETIGIVGRNGCGKSTLLQLICGIMPPTSGHIQVNGRISAILELGSGFNPEFSGRSNVYLNCSILGMDRTDVDKRIDEILGFADIGEFIDQPVKTYSSGMAVRLAFSIAINVDPAILIVDEALAVGDAAFARKCFSRIKAIQKQGTTILFVSHDAGTVVELCDRAILIDQGEQIYTGSPKKVISHYQKLLFAPLDKVDSVRNSILSSVDEVAEKNGKTEKKSKIQPESLSQVGGSKEAYNKNMIPKSTTWYESNGAVIQEPHVLTVDGRKVNMLVRKEKYVYTYRVSFTKDAFNVRFGMLIKTLRGVNLGGYGNRVEDEIIEHIKAGSDVLVKFRFHCTLLPGVYFFNAGVIGVRGKDDEYLHRGIDVSMFEVVKEENLGSTGTVDFGIVTDINLELPRKNDE